jgi:hypothetical protein
MHTQTLRRNAIPPLSLWKGLRHFHPPDSLHLGGPIDIRLGPLQDLAQHQLTDLRQAQIGVPDLVKLFASFRDAGGKQLIGHSDIM